VPEAQYNLGLMHYRGEGVPRQLHEALRWMRQAAANGHLRRRRAVGQLHLTGLDTMGQDLSEARTWLAAAANRGDREPERLLRELDRAQAAERDHARRLQVLSSYTAAHWASAAYRRPLVAPIRLPRLLRLVLTAHRLLLSQVTAV
jgi:TPR repeat protein